MKKKSSLACTLAVEKCASGRFSIHGLWFDENRNRKQIEMCKIKKNRIIDIPKNLRKNMENHWSYCNTKKKNDDHWKYEFCKHGYIFEEVEYYSLTIQAFNFFMYDIDLFEQAKKVSVGEEIHINLLYDLKNKTWQQNGEPTLTDYASRLKSLYDEIVLRVETLPRYHKEKIEKYKDLRKRLKSLFYVFEKFHKEIYPKKKITTI